MRPMTQGAWGRRLLVSALAGLVLMAFGLAVAFLPQDAPWINGGVLFADYSLLALWLLMVSGAWVRGTLTRFTAILLLASPCVLLLMAQGSVAASQAVANFSAIPYFALGTLLWAAVGAHENPMRDPRRDPALWTKGLLVGGLVLGAGLVGFRAWIMRHLQWPEDRNSLNLLMPPRIGIVCNDIGGEPYSPNAWLWFPFLWAALLAVPYAYRQRWSQGRLLGCLFVLGILGKYAVAGLSSEGLGIVSRKIVSVNTHYFDYAGTIGNPLAFLRDFNGLAATAGAHVDVHPPLPVFAYWVLRHLCFGRPGLAALGVMAFSVSALWPLYRLGKGLGGPDVGFAAAALFITSPLSLILGNAGIDSGTLTVVAFSLWFLWEAARTDSWRWAAASGACFGAVVLCSYGALAALMFFGTWGSLLSWRKTREIMGFLRSAALLWGAFAAALFAVALAFWGLSQGQFNYFSAMRVARTVHAGANQYRPYELWVWTNVELYAAYAGLGLLLLWGAKVLRSLVLADTSDGFTWLGLIMVLGLVLQAFGRGEVQREYLFGAVFLVPTAALALPRTLEGRVHRMPLALALGLNVLSAVVLEMYVLDYW